MELVMEDSRLSLVVSTGLFSVEATGELLSDSSDVGVGGRSPCSPRLRLSTDPTLGSFSLEAVLVPSSPEAGEAAVVISVLPSSSTYSESGRLLEPYCVTVTVTAEVAVCGISLLHILEEEDLEAVPLGVSDLELEIMSSLTGIELITAGQ